MTRAIDLIAADTEHLIDQALLALDTGDEVAQFPKATAEWMSGVDTSKTLTIDVARDGDLWVRGLNIYLSSRRVNGADPDGNGTDLTFRPASWTSTPNIPMFAVGGAAASRVADANASWLFNGTSHGNLSGAVPMSIAAAFSSQYGQGTVESEIVPKSWSGEHRFAIPERLKAGSSVNVELMATFGRLENAIIRTQFRATLVLNAFRRVRGPA